MTPSFLLKPFRSFKKELIVVLVVLASLIALPFVAVASSVTSVGALVDGTLQLFTGNASTNNTYDYGYCTFWAAQRRDEIGFAIPNTWGNANTWDDRAERDDYTVNNSPGVGAIMQSDAGDLGHVAFVEKVNPDGSWEVSEMNVKGWDILSNRTFAANLATNYKFIH
ncbi:MAG TPA: CHAP domain-containing protein [Candidatus Saccharimonadales bacterium]|nr:CHAP domain-containing protein [Candidatus Saccharimonadales bacterium]